MIKPYFKKKDFVLYHGDVFDVLKKLKISADCVFADPPYFLSNGGFTIQSGEIVSVEKGTWDKLSIHNTVNEFNYEWIKMVREVMAPSGTIWISGTLHNIFSIAQQLEELNFKILNAITWQKSNPPPNFTKRVFTHSTEIIIWARKEKKVPHFYNYELMKRINEGKQMKDVWKLPAIAPWEKKNGKHPTQKPLSILSRIILASSKNGDLILDPFTGASTTGIASTLFQRRFVGIDNELKFLDISIKRKMEIESGAKIDFIKKISGLSPIVEDYLS